LRLDLKRSFVVNVGILPTLMAERRKSIMAFNLHHFMLSLFKSIKKEKIHDEKHDEELDGIIKAFEDSKIEE
jgi:hypothetical protein